MQITENLTPYNHDSGRAGRSVTGIVLHTQVGWMAGSQARFFNPNSGVSANYGVGLNGEVRRWVAEGDTAYCNGNYQSNLNTISIEHEDGGDYNGPRTDALYQSSAELVADICRRYGIPCDRNHIKGHNEVIDTRYYPGGTACPDSLDLNRIIARANEILNPPAPAPQPPAPAPAAQEDKAPAGAVSEYSRLEAPLSLQASKQPTNVYNLDPASWGALSASVIKQLDAGAPFVAVGKAKHPLGGVYYMTAYSFGDADTSGKPAHNWGINTVDLAFAAVAPDPTPAPTPPPVEPPPIVVTPQPAPAVEPPVKADEQSIPVTVIPSDPDKWKKDLDKTYAGTYKAQASLHVKSLTSADEQQLVEGQHLNIAGLVIKDGIKSLVTAKSIETGKFFAIPPISVKAISLDEDKVFDLDFAAEAKELIGKMNPREKAIKTAASVDGFVHRIFHKK